MKKYEPHNENQRSCDPKLEIFKTKLHQDVRSKIRLPTVGLLTRLQSTMKEITMKWIDEN
jgi:hypothetical protein